MFGQRYQRSDTCFLVACANRYCFILWLSCCFLFKRPNTPGGRILSLLYYGFFYDSQLTGNSGQQCCYDDIGNLLVGAPGGGNVDRVSPDINIIDHFVEDLVPQWLCCKAGTFSNCATYYEHRPSDDCSRSIPPPPPGRNGYYEVYCMC